MSTAGLPQGAKAPPGGSVNTGIALFFCALVAFASYDAFCKQMLQYYPAPFINLMRYLAVICIAFAMLLHHGDLRIWRAPQKKLLLLRLFCCVAAAVYCWANCCCCAAQCWARWPPVS